MEVTQIIAIVVIILIAIFFIAWKIYKNGLRKVAIDLIVEVEERLNDNQEKLETVVNGIIAKLPFPFNILITYKAIENFVQKTFDEVKKALDYTPKTEKE